MIGQTLVAIGPEEECRGLGRRRGLEVANGIAHVCIPPVAAAGDFGAGVLAVVEQVAVGR